VHKTKNVVKRALMLLLALQTSGYPAFALKNTDVVYAIKKAEILAPGVGINARVVQDKVYVSTYRNSRANIEDCKIDAVLITKAIYDAAPSDIARVTVYFYGKDTSQYQEVSVTAGDIKAYATGQMSKEQLLSSLVVTAGKQQTDEDKIARQLESTSWVARPDYRVSKANDALLVTTEIDPWVSDDDVKLEAVRVAVNAMKAQPGVPQIKVSFTDPSGRAETREIAFSSSNLEDMWRSIQSPLAGLQVAKTVPSIDVQSLQISKGPHEAEREGVLVALKDMDKKGIGIGPFVKAFMQIEQTLNSEDPAKVLDMVTRLKRSLDDQLKAYTDAKNRPKPVAAAPVASTKAGPKGSRWVTGDQPIIEGEVLADPNKLVARFEAQMARGFPRVEDNPKYVLLLDQVAAILQKNNRGSEGARFQQKAAEIRARPRN
jgi:hypothetical protein